MFSRAVSAVLVGIESQVIHVEADVTKGLPFFELVGYLSAEVKEARERVKSAIRNAGFQLDPRRVIVNLSPADLRKSGTAYDLAIAAAVLCSYGYIKREALEQTIIVGELGLDGSIHPINGILSVVLMARKLAYRRCIVPRENEFEGAAVDGIEVYGIHTLKEIVDFLNQSCCLKPVKIEHRQGDYQHTIEGEREPDFSDILGQPTLKRGMEIAAAGMHHIMMMGPPGSGKSMAAKRLPTILPEMTWEECLEVSEIYSVAGLLHPEEGIITKRPFRSPHHTVTDIAMAGGGKIPKPGEMSLAHRGILFLDELTEFTSRTMEAMRQPLEDGKILVSRLQGSCEFPANFMLVAAMNPCRCGYYPDLTKCHCTPLQIKRYIGRISQPLMDRIDLNIEVKPVKIEFLQSHQAMAEERSESIRLRVEKARKIQSERYRKTPYLYNSQLMDRDVDMYCILGQKETAFMKKVYHQFGLSARSYHKILKVARTIADLSGDEQITKSALSEAIFYKTIDRSYWSGSYGAK